MTKLMQSHQRSIMKKSLMLTPLALLGFLIVGGHAHANASQITTGSSIQNQNTQSKPTNINDQKSLNSGQSTNNMPSSRSSEINRQSNDDAGKHDSFQQTSNDRQNSPQYQTNQNSLAELNAKLAKMGIPVNTPNYVPERPTNKPKIHRSLGDAKPIKGNNPWDVNNSTAYKNMSKATIRYQSAPMNLTYPQAAGVMGVVSVDNPTFTDAGLGKKIGNKYSIGIFRVTQAQLGKYKANCAEHGLDPKNLGSMYEAPAIINDSGWSTFQNQNNGDPYTNALLFMSDFMEDRTGDSVKMAKNAQDVDGAFAWYDTNSNVMSPQKGVNNNVDDSTGVPKPENTTSQIFQIPVVFKCQGKVVGTTTVPVNPALIMGYASSGNNLSEIRLLNGSGDWQNPNSPDETLILNQVPQGYSNSYGYGIEIDKQRDLLIKNGKQTKNKLIMTVLKQNNDHPWEVFPQTDNKGTAPIESDDAQNGASVQNAEASNPNIKPGHIDPSKGLENGNQHSDSSDQTPTSKSENGDNGAGVPSGDNNGGGSGGGSGSGKGAAAAAGTASTATGAAGGAGGGATGGASSTGGGSSTGGAGGGTDGTTGGVVGGGSGNNNSAVPGPTNNDVIPGGSSTSNNNNDDNNNVVDESPIVNNNDHTSDDIHHNYEAEVRDDTALIGIIANLAATDQKNHQVMADLIDKDGNQSVMRQLQKAEYASNIRTQQEDQNSSLAAEIQRTANAHHSENETQSLADHFAMQSAELSMAQSAEIANLKSAPKAKSVALQVNNNVQPETAPVNQNQSNNGNSIGTDIMNKFDDALNGVTDQLGNISSQLGNFHASAASNNAPAPANIVQPSMSSESSQSSTANNQIMTNFDNLLNSITGGSGSSSASSSNSANNSPIMNNFDKILNNIAPSSGSYEPAHSSSASEKPTKTKKASENGPFFYNPDGSEDYAKERQFDEDHGDPYAYFVGYNGSHGLISPAPAPVEMPQIIHLAENKAKAKKNNY